MLSCFLYIRIVLSFMRTQKKSCLYVFKLLVGCNRLIYIMWCTKKVVSVCV